MDTYDLIVIGSGPAGRRAAVQAAKLGHSVLVVEGRRRVGGVSVHTGTIPSKTLRETALNLSGWRERGFYGHSYRVKKDICGNDLGNRLTKTLEHEVDVLEHQFQRNGVQTCPGTARFLDANRLSVRGSDDRELVVKGTRILIAVGTVPFRPNDVPFDDSHVLDSDSMIETPRVPRSLVVIGAGVIGIEYATIFSAMDVPVTLIEPRDSFLDFIDREIIDEFVHELRDRGMVIRLGLGVARIERATDGPVITTLTDGRVLRSDMLLYAAGRAGATEGLDLDKCGLAADNRGRLKVDAKTFQTEVPHIYAAGDVIGPYYFTHMASHQASRAVLNALFPLFKRKIDYSIVPWTTFTQPEIAAVGLNEESAKQKGIPFDVTRIPFSEVDRAVTDSITDGFIKVLTKPGKDKILGATIVGEHAGELIMEYILAMKEGIGLGKLLTTIHVYPTLMDGNRQLAAAWQEEQQHRVSGVFGNLGKSLIAA